MKKKKNRFGLIVGFGKRFIILTIIYVVFMLSMWTTLGQFFQEGVGFNWIFWLVIAGSLIMWIGLIVYVEHAQLKRYGHD
jgi:hypothetical protein